MKSMRISVITLALGLAAGASTAWGAQSVMALISGGEAIMKEVTDSKADYDGAVQKQKDLVAEAKELNAQNDQLTKDMADYKTNQASIQSREADYQKSCGPDQKLTQDQYTACQQTVQSINGDIAKNSATVKSINSRVTELKAKSDAHNEAIKTAQPNVTSTYASWTASLKKQTAWLDQTRDMILSQDFKSYAQKAGCPDVNKPVKTPEAQMKMSSDVIACLKKVSST